MKIGWTKAHRKELESDIWKMPPLYQRVFYYLRQEASWESEFFPTRKKYKIALNPGQLITSFSIISEGVSWYEYGVKRVPNKKTIKDILDWLEGNSMVTAFSNRHGTFIIITNWDTYNSQEKEKVTQNNQQDVTLGKRSPDTLKEGKESLRNKEIKDNIYIPVFDFWNLQKIVVHKKIDSKTKTAIKTALKTYQDIEIKQAIESYSIVLKSDQYFFNYKWPLVDFLNRGLKNFVNEADPMQNYLANKTKQGLKEPLNTTEILTQKDIDELNK